MGLWILKITFNTKDRYNRVGSLIEIEMCKRQNEFFQFREVSPPSGENFAQNIF